MSPIRVLIADDQALVRGALATLLGLESDLEVVAQVGRGDEVLPAVREHAVDVALVDIDMPGRDGLAATADVVSSETSCRCLIVTTFGRPGYLSRGMEAGAAGFIVKDTPPEALADAIRKVHAGLRVIDPELAQESVLLGPNPRTDREKEVLLAAATGRATSASRRARRISVTVALTSASVRRPLPRSWLKEAVMRSERLPNTRWSFLAPSGALVGRLQGG